MGQEAYRLRKHSLPASRDVVPSRRSTLRKTGGLTCVKAKPVNPRETTWSQSEERRMDEPRVDLLPPARQSGTGGVSTAIRPAPPLAGTGRGLPAPNGRDRRARARRRRWGLGGLAALAAIALALGAWWMLPTDVAVVTPSRGPAVQAVFATGSVEAPVTVPLSGRVTARLAQLYADEGDSVKTGQLLVRFEDSDLQETMRQAQAQEVYAKQAFDRIARLLKTGTSTQADYDKAYSAWQAAQAATRQAAAQVGFLQLASPADGRVIRRDGEVGQLIPAGQTVLWLARDDPLRITSEVDEEDVSLVHAGQEVLIRADAFPGKVFRGRVQAVTPMGDATARTYRVRIEFTETAPFMIGMTAETNIIVSEHQNALLLPASALDGDAVWRVSDGRLEKAPVSIGIRGTDKVEVLGGVAENDQVVATPGSSLYEGMRVRAVRASPP
jgi:RND family efflux transporter MFP subunit